MQAAKAKAAAAAARKAAAQKKAEAAAQQAQLEAAAARAAAASAQQASSISTRARPNITQYWADSASSIRVPGGGIHRIGFDVARFEQAVQECLLDPKPCPDDWLPNTSKGDTTNGHAEAQASEVKKEDIALLVREMEVSEGQAKSALKKANGDLGRAVSQLTAPSLSPPVLATS